MQDYGAKMAYAHNFIKVTNTFSLIGTDEIGSFGFHMGKTNADLSLTQYNLIGAEINDIAQACLDFWNTNANDIPSGWGLSSTKIALIGTNGKYQEFSSAYEFIHETPVPGPTPVASAPQLSAVVTVNSIRPRDPGRYNRFYVPTTAASNGPYKIQPTATASLADTTVTMLNEISDVMTGTGTEVIPLVVSASGAGSASPVIAVRVGDVIDTQRRRRNKLPETYTVRSL